VTYSKGMSESGDSKECSCFNPLCIGHVCICRIYCMLHLKNQSIRRPFTQQFVNEANQIKLRVQLIEVSVLIFVVIFYRYIFRTSISLLHGRNSLARVCERTIPTE
jgi:hypothetical protein